MMTQQLTVTMEQQDYDGSRFMTHWLKAWKIGERLPEAANREEITDLQRLHHEWLQPVTAETFAVIFDKFWRFGSVYQLNGMGKHATNEGAVVKEATKFYFEAMQHLPADLVALAVDRVVKTWTYKNSRHQPTCWHWSMMNMQKGVSLPVSTGLYCRKWTGLTDCSTGDVMCHDSGRYRTAFFRCRKSGTAHAACHAAEQNNLVAGDSGKRLDELCKRANRGKAYSY